MNKIEAITAFSRNANLYGLSIKESSILIAVAQISAYRQSKLKPNQKEKPYALMEEVTAVTGMNMRNTISRLGFWLEIESIKTGKTAKSRYSLNKSGMSVVNKLLDFQHVNLKEITTIKQ